MKVIVTIEYEPSWAYGYTDHKTVTVRKCPPNYKPQDEEHVVEVDDYSEEDIKEYFEKPGIEWRGWKKKKLKKLEKQGASESEIKHWKDKHKDPVK